MIDIETEIQAGRILPLAEEFYTIQGEGFHTGKAAYFIRLGGCDIGCRWCDSKKTWNRDLHKLESIENIVKSVAETPAKSVIITGGEPCLYNLNPLTRLLKDHGVMTFLETSGAYEISGEWDWVCVSPKRNKAPHNKAIIKASELKVVIHNFKEDILWAESQAVRVGAECLLYLQPEWSRMRVNKDSIVSYVKKNPRWQLSVQMHNFMDIP